MSYKITLAKDYRLYVPEFAGKIFATIEKDMYYLSPGGQITPKAGYSWDRASFWPDGKKMKYPPINFKVEFTDPDDYIRTLDRATLGHDLIWQYAEEIAGVLGMNKKQVILASNIFLYTTAKIDGDKGWRKIRFFFALTRTTMYNAMRFFKGD